MKILVVYAIAEEKFPLEIEGAELVEIFAGIGKTMAATSVALAIAKHNPDLVLNIGTVGTYSHKVGDVLVARRFIDRNMKQVPIDATCNELDMQKQSFAYGLRSVIDGKETDIPVTINTGDNFVTCADEALGCDAVDMESFAMAWVCKQTSKPFLSVKYVTDILGQNSVAVWSEKLAQARHDLEAYFKAYGNLILQ